MSPTVLITGASEGIGKATALVFAHRGYDVILAARHSEQLATVANEIQALGRSALAVPTDVRLFEQVSTLINTALDKYGSIDVLVNNAGIYISGPVARFSLDDWRQTIDTNLWGYIHTVHALLPHLLQQGSGTIVNVCSIGGKTAIPYLTPYTTSKFAITGFTEALHAELAPKGIHVCGVYPNLIKSDFLDRAIFRGNDTQDVVDRKQQIEQVLRIPVVEKPDDVANAIWNGVKHQRAEVIVGSAKLSIVADAILPGMMQRFMRLIFRNRD
ncbi:SDR family NAD(P)-dependent oxidoreductase [Thermocoleostomius sinensis]|uniref:SDR family NAD(P)-dependent oxidoreductase n=1 Tax=Thermocoleostomius sinensis A174 TaxID=2016057 RepID=A0A9E8ZEU8_9CYAN|nr:SDR family oxidoreductase [Thermocoleostomius sinensis]WAL61732.1 SDR family NAD(P)-dependent oxidoreductase [Thermocoleostomius sinensis A174]